MIELVKVIYDDPFYFKLFHNDNMNQDDHSKQISLRFYAMLSDCLYYVIYAIFCLCLI